MPDEVGESSGVVVWWICENMHIWPASPNHRKRRIKCPTCAGKKVYGDDFEIINGSIQQLKTIRRVLGKDKRLDITTRALIGKISDIQAIFEKDVKKKFIIAINQKPSLDVSMEYNKIRRFELGISKVVEDYKGTGLFIHLKTPVNSSTRRMLEKEVNRHKTFSSFIIKPIYFRENELLIFNVDEYLTKLIRVLTQLKRKRKSIYIDRILSLISD